MDYLMNVTEITLGGHVDLQKYRYLYFLLTFTVYAMIVSFNSSFIFVIYLNECLHEPMYVFIAALLSNSLFGSTVLFPKLLIDLLSEQQTTSYYACLFQTYFAYMYATTEITLLSAMAYDRYVSICKPLQYATLIGLSTVKKLVFFSWLVPSCELAVMLILTLRLQLCKSKMNSIYCDNYSIVRLSCGDTSTRSMVGLFVFIIAMFPPVIFIMFSYIRILSVCLKNSKDFRRKALQTCLPHLIILSILSVNMSFEVIHSRLSSEIPHLMAMILSIDYLLIPPLFNPIIYGLKLQEISSSLKKMVLRKNRTKITF